MLTLPTDEEYRWLAKQRPHHKKQNRILLLNSKKAQLLREQQKGTKKI